MKQSVIIMRNYLLSRGYEIIVSKQPNGRFKAVLFKNDVFVRDGKKEYLRWNECIEETEEKFYLHKNKNN